MSTKRIKETAVVRKEPPSGGRFPNAGVERAITANKLAGNSTTSDNVFDTRPTNRRYQSRIIKNTADATSSNFAQYPPNRYCPVCQNFRSRSRNEGRTDDNVERNDDERKSRNGAIVDKNGCIERASRRSDNAIRQRFDVLNDDLLLLNDVNSRLREELDIAKSELSRKNAETQELRRSLEQEIVDIRRENETLSDQLNSKETNLLRCERQLAKSQADKRRLEEEMQRLNAQTEALSREIASIRKEIASRPGGGVVRWRSDNALNQTETDSDSDARRRRTTTIRTNTRSVSPTSKLRGTATASGGGVNRYCPVCRKFRNRNFICTNIATAGSLVEVADSSNPVRVSAERDFYRTQLETLRARQRQLNDTTGDSGFTDRDSSPEQRVDVRRRFADLNNDLMKLTDENRRLHDELHKLRVEKAVSDTEKNSTKRLLEQLRDELRILRQENTELRARRTTTPQPSANVLDSTSVTRIVRSSSTDKAREERILRDNDDLKSEIASLRNRFETEKARYDANMSLLSAQKTKLEQDNVGLKASNETLAKSNELMQNQLHVMDDRISSMQRSLIDAKVSSKECEGRDKNSAYVADMQNNLSDLNAKFRHSEMSRLTLEKKLGEVNKLADDAAAENSRLRSKLASAEQNLLRLEGESGAQNLRINEFEKQLQSKDRDISRLKGIIRELEQEYDNFRKSLAEQEGNLVRLQRDLTVTGGMKDQAEKSRTLLLDDYKRLQDQFQKVHGDNAALQRELEASLEEQEKLRRNLQRYSSEIHSYEKQLAQKEKERTDLLNRYQETTTEIRRMEAHHTSAESQVTLESQAHRWELNKARDQIASLKSENEKLLREQDLLKDQLKKCELSLDQLQNALDGAKAQNQSLQADLTSLRQLAINMDSVKLQLVQELSEKDMQLKKAQCAMDDITLELELLRTQVNNEHSSFTQIDSALKETRESQIRAEVDAQQKTEEARYMRDRIAEYELKLELQGRDLNNLRTKLTRAEGEIEQLRRQLIEEQSS